MKEINDKVKVSVIVPNYNHAKYLRQRIDSIIEQTFSDYEIILLDDCSTDNSREILLTYQDNSHLSHIVFNKENSGSPFLQWEKGIQLAKGEYIWIAESDDYASPFFLEYTVNALESHPGATVCYTDFYIVDSSGKTFDNVGYYEWEEDGNTYLFQSREFLKSHIIDRNSIYNASAVVFKREDCFLNISQAYKNMRYAGDWLFWIEQCRKGDVVEIRKKLNYFRKHLNNTTNKGNETGEVVAELIQIKKHIYKNIPLSWQERMIDKVSFYRYVKYYPMPQSLKKELLKSLDVEIGMTCVTYFIGLKLKSYLKHFKHKK